MIYPATKPIIAEPRLKPVNIIVIISERRLRGAYSDNNVEAFGMAAPMPLPARNRRSAISAGEDAYAATSVKAPKGKTEKIRTIFRPDLSEDGPATSAPMTRPKGAALITMPKAGLDIIPFLKNRRGDEAHNGNVHAVGDDHEEADRNEEPLESRDPLLVDEGLYVDRIGHLSVSVPEFLCVCSTCLSVPM
jgi:hypothetical protein